MLKMNDKLYDRLKYLAIIGLPAAGTLYRSLAAIWNLPGGEEVPATLAAFGTALGAWLCISTAEYNKNKNKE